MIPGAPVAILTTILAPFWPHKHANMFKYVDDTPVPDSSKDNQRGNWMMFKSSHYLIFNS